jgi:peroxiredoxin
MKTILFFSFVVLTTGMAAGQDLVTKPLTQGFPAPLKPFFDFYGKFTQEEVKSAEFITGTDSLQAWFGHAEKKDKSRTFYWAAITNGDSLITLSAGFILEKDTNEKLTQNVKLQLGKDRPEYVTFQINADPADENTIYYSWLNKAGQKTGSATVISDEKFVIGNPVPDFEFFDLDGKSLRFENYKGKILVLNWWNTGCKPCIAEMPGLNTLADHYSDNENVVFLAISHNTAKEISQFLRKRTFNYFQSTYSQNALAYFGESYPVHLIVDPNGKIAYYTSGGGPNMHLEIENALNKVIR